MNISMVKDTLAKHSPQILTGMSVVGVVVTTGLTIRATSNARDILDTLYMDENIKEEDLKKEKFKRLLPEYIPVFMSATATIICIIGAHIVEHKRAVSFASAYMFANTALVECKDAIIEKIGPKKAEEVKNLIAQKKVADNQPDGNNIVVLEDGSDTLIYDTNSGRYFRSSIERLKRIEGDLNRDLRLNDWVSLNDIYDAIGLDTVKIGDNLGFDAHGKADDIMFDFDAILTDENKPCIAVSFDPQPKYVNYYGG